MNFSPTQELPCRRVPDHVTMSRIAYIKRKYVEDEDSYITFRSYCKTVRLNQPFSQHIFCANILCVCLV